MPNLRGGVCGAFYGGWHFRLYGAVDSDFNAGDLFGVAGISGRQVLAQAAGLVSGKTNYPRRSGISATNLSLLENEKVDIGKKRVEQIAPAFEVRPAIIMFLEYEAKEIAKVA